MSDARGGEEACWAAGVKTYGGSVSSSAPRRFEVFMEGKGFDDEQMLRWCEWFHRHCEKLRTAAGKPLVGQCINFAKNKLTAVGLRLLFDVLYLHTVVVNVLKVYQNNIEARAGVDLAEFVARNDGKLAELHLSHNSLDTSAASEIITAAVAAMDCNGESCYPQDGVAPLWLRLEQNHVEPAELQARLRPLLQRLGRSVEASVCHVKSKDNSKCRPKCCTRLDPPPAVHVTYLAGRGGGNAAPLRPLRLQGEVGQEEPRPNGSRQSDHPPSGKSAPSRPFRLHGGPGSEEDSRPNVPRQPSYSSSGAAGPITVAETWAAWTPSLRTPIDRPPLPPECLQSRPRQPAPAHDVGLVPPPSSAPPLPLQQPVLNAEPQIARPVPAANVREPRPSTVAWLAAGLAELSRGASTSLNAAAPTFIPPAGGLTLPTATAASSTLAAPARPPGLDIGAPGAEVASGLDATLPSASHVRAESVPQATGQSVPAAVEGKSATVAALQGTWSDGRDPAMSYTVIGMRATRSKWSSGVEETGIYPMQWNSALARLEWGAGKYYLERLDSMDAQEARWWSCDGRGRTFSWRRRTAGENASAPSTALAWTSTQRTPATGSAASPCGPVRAPQPPAQPPPPATHVASGLGATLPSASHARAEKVPQATGQYVPVAVEGESATVAALQGTWSDGRDPTMSYTVVGVQATRTKLIWGVEETRIFLMQWNSALARLEWGASKYYLERLDSMDAQEARWWSCDDRGRTFSWRRRTAVENASAPSTALAWTSTQRTPATGSATSPHGLVRTPQPPAQPPPPPPDQQQEDTEVGRPRRRWGNRASLQGVAGTAVPDAEEQPEQFRESRREQRQ